MYRIRIEQKKNLQINITDILKLYNHKISMRINIEGKSPNKQTEYALHWGKKKKKKKKKKYK
jgi:hypothetical protein